MTQLKLTKVYSIQLGWGVSDIADKGGGALKKQHADLILEHSQCSVIAEIVDAVFTRLQCLHLGMQSLQQLCISITQFLINIFQRFLT